MVSNLQVKGYLPVEEIKKRDVTFFIISFISAMSCCGMLPDTSIIKAISITTGHSKRWIFTRSDLNRICASATIMDKSPWENNAILIFFFNSAFLHKTVHPFQNFLAVLPPHHPIRIQCWNSENILNTRVQHCLWGEGGGWACVNWKTPRNAKVSWLLSTIVVLFTKRLSFVISLWLPVCARIKFKIVPFTSKGNKGPSL